MSYTAFGEAQQTALLTQKAIESLAVNLMDARLVDSHARLREYVLISSPLNKAMKHQPQTDKPQNEPWTYPAAHEIYHFPLNDLLFKAQSVHRQYFDPNTVQLSTLLNIKSGGCPEDCAYCPQSARYDTGVESESMLDVNQVQAAALAARDNGATRFCMGAAWRQLRDRDMDRVIELVGTIKSLGLESCLTVGMLTGSQARKLKEAGLDYYNHNIDSSREFYQSIISTRDFDDRLETLAHVRDAGINVCCGGIIGMGESESDRIKFLLTLANLPAPPESVPINTLVRVAGTPLADRKDLDAMELVRTIATARIMMPGSVVRLSAGRADMSDELQALCFHAGANSIFYGDKLLTTENPRFEKDRALFDKLGISVAAGNAH